MSVEKVECVMISCDNCGMTYESFEGFSIFNFESDVDVEDDGWHKTEGENPKHYCNSCHKVDDDDNLIIDESRKDLYNNG